MGRLFLLFMVYALLSAHSFSQSIGIGTIAPNASAALDISSSNKGLLPPRMSYSQIKAIPNPAAGLIVYDTEFGCIRLFDGTDWKMLSPQNKNISDPPGDFGGWGISSSNTRTWTIKADATGNVYIAGDFTTSTAQFGDVILNNNGLGDIFLVKYDPSGKVLWARSFGGSSNDECHDLEIDALGNVVFVGMLSSTNFSFGSSTVSTQGQADIFVAKCDSSGNPIWITVNGGDKADFGWAIALDAAGNSYITGNHKSNTYSYGPNLIFGDGIDQNIILAKYNSAGVVEWARGIGGSGADEGKGIVVDALGNSYIIGNFSSIIILLGGSVAVTSAGGKDIFLFKYDANGSALWARSGGGTGTDAVYGTSMAIDNSGNIILAGNYASSSILFSGGTSLTNISSGKFDFVMVKYTSTGDWLWNFSNGGSGDEQVLALAYDNTDDAFYLAGTFNCAFFRIGNSLIGGYTNSSSYVTDDIFISKIANLASNNEYWGTTGGGASTDEPWAMSLYRTTNGVRLYTAAHYAPTARFGTKLLTSGQWFLWNYGE